MFEDVDVAISRTHAAYRGTEEVREIEALYLDMIAAAAAFIYFENQYFTSGRSPLPSPRGWRSPTRRRSSSLCRAPPKAGWSRRRWMAARLKLMAAIGHKDPGNRFRVYVPVTKGGEDIYVHAKVAIVDDRLLRVGSSNLNNRSMGLDSECDVTIDAALPANRDTGPAITALRHRLLAEHLGCSEQAVAEAERQASSMVDAIEALRGEGRRSTCSTWKRSARPRNSLPRTSCSTPKARTRCSIPIAKRGLAKSWAKGPQCLAAWARTDEALTNPGPGGDDASAACHAHRPHLPRCRRHALAQYALLP